MIESATGIILRTRPLTETSVIVHWLTPDLGRVSTVAKGARRPKSPFAGKLDLFYIADFMFTRSQRSELHVLREMKLRELNSPLREEMGWLKQACYAAALIEQATERETPLPAIYNLMRGLLDHLPQHPPQPRTTYAFELKLLDELGMRPDLDDSKLPIATSTLLVALLESDWNELASLTATATQARELHQFLHGFLIYHLGKIPKGRA